jgi:hypothetical protein
MVFEDRHKLSSFFATSPQRRINVNEEISDSADFNGKQWVIVSCQL